MQMFIHSYRFIRNARKWNLDVNSSKRAVILFSIIFVNVVNHIVRMEMNVRGSTSTKFFSLVTCSFQHFQISFQRTS
jgi:hypothetical protein